MTRERYDLLMKDDTVPLSDAELKDGWHFCYEFDGLLVGPGMGEASCCNSGCGATPEFLATDREIPTHKS